jgi:hypothetical protein
LISFMKRLMHGRKQRVCLILDNLRVHHSKAVKMWLSKTRQNPGLLSTQLIATVEPRRVAQRRLEAAHPQVRRGYSETRVGVSRKHCTKVDATIRERRPCTKLTGPHELWFRSRNKMALTCTAIGSMRSIQKQPEHVKGYFGQKDISYAAA